MNHFIVLLDGSAKVQDAMNNLVSSPICIHDVLLETLATFPIQFNQDAEQIKFDVLMCAIDLSALPISRKGRRIVSLAPPAMLNSAEYGSGGVLRNCL